MEDKWEDQGLREVVSGRMKEKEERKREGERGNGVAQMRGGERFCLLYIFIPILIHLINFN